jgi:hypothetical protein
MAQSTEPMAKKTAHSDRAASYYLSKSLFPDGLHFFTLQISFYAPDFVLRLNEWYAGMAWDWLAFLSYPCLSAFRSVNEARAI